MAGTPTWIFLSERLWANKTDGVSNRARISHDASDCFEFMEAPPPASFILRI
jgi:hypothetical protein